jgi:hypothetical protein
MIQQGEKYIVDARIAWIDSKTYDYVYGKCYILNADEAVGFNLRRSENWFIKVVGGNTEVIIPGCRVGSLVRTDVTPKAAEEEANLSYKYLPANILIL